MAVGQVRIVDTTEVIIETFLRAIIATTIIIIIVIIMTVQTMMKVVIIVHDQDILHHNAEIADHKIITIFLIIIDQLIIQIILRCL